MSQIFLFTGENHYALSEEKHRWIENFTSKHGSENLERREAKEVTYRTLLDDTAYAPFIAESRLVIVQGIPQLEKGQIGELKKQIHPQVVLLFIEPKPDKRVTAVKELLSIAEVKHFAPLTRVELLHWVESHVRELDSSLTEEGKRSLLDAVGEDQGLLAQELTKIVLFSDGQPITSRDVEDIVVCSSEQVAWKLMEFIGNGRLDEAVMFTHRLFEKGESPYVLWNQLLWMISSLVQICSAVQEGKNSIGEIVKSTGVNFGAVKSMLPIVRKMNMDQIRSIAGRFAQADIDLKSGNIRATAEAPQELMVLIDRSLMSIG